MGTSPKEGPERLPDLQRAPHPRTDASAHSCRADGPPECPFHHLLDPAAARSCQSSSLVQWVFPPNTCLVRTGSLMQTDAYPRTRKCTHSHTGTLAQARTLTETYTRRCLTHAWMYTHTQAHSHTHTVSAGEAQSQACRASRPPCGAERGHAGLGALTCHGCGLPAGETALSRAQPPLLSGAVQLWTGCEGTFHLPILEENQGHRPVMAAPQPWAT